MTQTPKCRIEMKLSAPITLAFCVAAILLRFRAIVVQPRTFEPAVLLIAHPRCRLATSVAIYLDWPLANPMNVK